MVILIDSGSSINRSIVDENKSMVVAVCVIFFLNLKFFLFSFNHTCSTSAFYRRSFRICQTWLYIFIILSKYEILNSEI